MKNLFITGALGQDGTILTNILKKNKNLNIYLLVENNKSVKRKKNLIKINLLNLEQIENIFSKIKPHYILHLGSRNPSYKESNYKKFYKENMQATKNIFYSAFKFNIKSKFLFCNSSQIFKKKNGIVDEKSKYEIKSDYTKFRIECDRIMQNFKKKYNIKYTNIIMFNHDSIYRNQKFLIPRIIKSLLRKNIDFLNKIVKENICGDFSHADDICNGLIKILFNKKNENNIILGSGYLTSMTEIINYIIKKRKIFLKIRKFEAQPKMGLLGNPSLIKRKFNWKTKKSIFDASLEIYDFYKRNSLR